MNENEQNSQNDNILLEQNTNNNNKKIVAYASFALGFLLMLLIILWAISSLNKSEEENTQTQEQRNVNLSDSVKKNKEFVLKNNDEKSLLDISSTPQSLPSKENTPQSETNLLENTFAKPRIVKGMGIAVIKTTNANQISNANSNANFEKKPDTVFDFGQNGSSSKNTQANASQTGEIFTPTAASFSKFNPSLLLAKGTYIGCALQTRLISEIKGGISCIVSNDVYSSNGHTLLIEKGSTITGAYSSGELNDGSTRLFVIWQEIRTPNNIVIPVFSGATDPLGAAGMEGYVNHHYMKRFSAAILLSVIDDSFAILANELSKNSTSNTNIYNFTENTRESASEIANTALEKMIDIKPTLYKNQGDLVGVYVNKDIDFSKVYKLQRKR